MKITCTLGDVIRTVQSVRAASTTESLPILRGVLFIAKDDGQITLSTGNLICAMTISLLGTSEECGEGVTPLEPLLGCFQSLLHTHAVTETITLCDDGTFFGVNTPTGKAFSLERLRPEEFPRLWSDADALDFCTLPSRRFRDCIAQVLCAADPDPYAGLLSCIWVQTDVSGSVTFAATDRWRIAVRTLPGDHSSSRATIFLIPGETLATLLPCLAACDEQITVQVDHGTLHIRSESRRIVARLHEEIRRDNALHYGEPVNFTKIPFVRHLPMESTRLLFLPTAKLKVLLRKQELLHWSLTEDEGRWHVLIERYGIQGAMRGKKKGSPITLSADVWGEEPGDFWLSSWMLSEIVSAPGASPVLVLAMDDSVPAKILVRWFDVGMVRQDVSYAMCAQDSYLAKLSTILGTPLSQRAQQVLSVLLRGHTRWADENVWRPALVRILLMIEHNMKPTEEDIRRIVPHPERFTERYDQLTQSRDKRERERRLDWLLIQVAIQSFTLEGATFTVSFRDELHLQASMLEDRLVVTSQVHREG